MPDHFHLLISEPQIGDPSKVMQLVKQLFAQRVVPRTRRKRSGAENVARKSEPLHIWEARFYDFNVYSDHKRIEHQNPVKRGFVDQPEQWSASSAHRTDLVTEDWPWIIGEE